MERFDRRSPSAFRMTAEAPAERVTAFLQKVYGWMFIGLAVTAVVAFMVAGSPTLLRHIVSNQFLFFGLIVAQLGLVFYLSARVETLAPTTAMTLFIVYSALNGVTLSFILLVYTGESIASTFVVTSGMFGALALFGSTTKRSLAGDVPVADGTPRGRDHGRLGAALRRLGPLARFAMFAGVLIPTLGAGRPRPRSYRRRLRRQWRR